MGRVGVGARYDRKAVAVRRAGFTLLEVMVAVVLTGVVALTALVAARVSAEAHARLDAGLRSVQSDRAVRQTLLDLLHNVLAPRQRADTSLVLKGDTLRFVAAGAPPLDPDYDWLLELRPGPAGLELAARTLGRASARIGFRIPRVTRWEVRVWGPGDTEWRREWAQAAMPPRGIAITFWGDSQPLGPPLTVRLSEALPSGGAESDLSIE